MKKLFSFFVILTSLILLTDCGKDGADGRAYIALDWDWYVDWYEDSNSDTPSSFYANSDYETSAGSYNYEYGCSDVDYYGNWYYWGWEGTYTISINPGEKGGLISSGSDGADNYFQFNLWGSGPDFYLNKPVNGKEKALILTVPSEEIKFYKKTLVGNVIIETYENSNATMIITRQKFILEK
jgi:hypothetical protein